MKREVVKRHLVEGPKEFGGEEKILTKRRRRRDGCNN